MEKLTAAQIRSKYLAFFERNGHTIVPSSSLVVANDPTLLFANSGMVPFKDVFLGLEQRPYTRATSSQRCLRVSGKHNDLDEVGPSPRHHTFFEMLGNFSFGDYFKAEAIRLAWELLTKEFELPVERLWFTIFEGDAEVPADEEAARLWIEQGVDPSHILRFGRAENFWVMGDSGPCGPCSEITMYIGDDLSKMGPEGVNSEDPAYVEIWNNVFMQFERATMKPLPRPSVDTGMGLERMAMAVQGVPNTYDTDLFVAIIGRVIAELGSDEAHYRANFAPYRAVADHCRSIAFLIADGVLPGNGGRSYVLRRILRRAAYQGRLIGFERPFLAQVTQTVIEQMGAAYPELRARRDFILETTESEERQFLRTLAGGLTRLEATIATVRERGEAALPAEDAFLLKDTFGFPLDLTQRIVGERGLSVDAAAYDGLMNAQRERGRKAAQFKRGAEADLWAEQSLQATVFTGYTELVGTAKVLAMLAGGDELSSATSGQQVQIALDTTPFYAESGGQVGDSGLLVGPHGSVRVEDTLRPVPGLFVHYGVVEQGIITVGDPVTATVDAARRADIQRNHTATHMLQRVLRDVVGEHAAQAGSLVSPDRLRFDFTHPRPVEAAQLREIEQRLNAWVRADGLVSWRTTDYQNALDSGAIALFGEKYGDVVRVVSVERGDAPPTRRGEASPEAATSLQNTQGDASPSSTAQNTQGDASPSSTAQNTQGDASPSSPSLTPPPFASKNSVELCGGTHIGRTGEIGYLRVVSESSVGSGLRRIEALSGRGAEAWVEAQVGQLRELATKLSTPPAMLSERLDALLAEDRQRQQELAALRGKLTRGSLEGLLAQVQRENGLALLTARVEAEESNGLREMGDWLRDKLGSAVIVLGTVIDDKPQLLAMVTPDLVAKGYHAGNLVKALAAIVGGGGGGRPDMAQAGGKDSAQLDAALAKVPELIKK